MATSREAAEIVERFLRTVGQEPVRLAAAIKDRVVIAPMVEEVAVDHAVTEPTRSKRQGRRRVDARNLSPTGTREFRVPDLAKPHGPFPMGVKGVRNLFRDEPGVRHGGHLELLRKGSYDGLYIPEPIAYRVLLRITRQQRQGN